MPQGLLSISHKTVTLPHTHRNSVTLAPFSNPLLQTLLTGATFPIPVRPLCSFIHSTNQHDEAHPRCHILPSLTSKDAHLPEGEREVNKQFEYKLTCREQENHTVLCMHTGRAHNPIGERGRARKPSKTVSVKRNPRGQENRQSNAMRVCAQACGRKGHLQSQGGGTVRGLAQRESMAAGKVSIYKNRTFWRPER